MVPAVKGMAVFGVLGALVMRQLALCRADSVRAVVAVVRVHEPLLNVVTTCFWHVHEFNIAHCAPTLRPDAMPVVARRCFIKARYCADAHGFGLIHEVAGVFGLIRTEVHSYCCECCMRSQECERHHHANLPTCACIQRHENTLAARSSHMTYKFSVESGCRSCRES